MRDCSPGRVLTALEFVGSCRRCISRGDSKMVLDDQYESLLAALTEARIPSDNHDFVSSDREAHHQAMAVTSKANSSPGPLGALALPCREVRSRGRIIG